MTSLPWTAIRKSTPSASRSSQQHRLVPVRPIPHTPRALITYYWAAGQASPTGLLCWRVPRTHVSLIFFLSLINLLDWNWLSGFIAALCLSDRNFSNVVWRRKILHFTTFICGRKKFPQLLYKQKDGRVIFGDDARPSCHCASWQHTLNDVPETRQHARPTLCIKIPSSLAPAFVQFWTFSFDI